VTVEGFIHWLSFYCGTKKWHSMVPAGSLETERSKGGGIERGRCLLWVGEDSESHLLLKRPETPRWREKLLRSTWHHIKEKGTFKKILTAKNATQ
jgi:hypothetical protein